MRFPLPIGWFPLWAVLAVPTVAADEPLHRQIDRLVEGAMDDAPPQAPSDDAEFVRRAYLDLAGRIPARDETRHFLDDPSSGKRQELVERLLNGPEYPRRMQELFHTMLMERRADNEEWTRFLRTAFEQNLPWDQMVRVIVKADGDDEARRGAAFFLTARLVSEGAMAPVDVPGLTRDVGRLLAGVDLQCAQCHDHVSVDEYKQRDFQGLHMIFENVQTRRDVQFPAVAENLMTDKKEFSSVFTGETMQTAPVIPGGGEIEIATFAKGEEYRIPPDRRSRTPGEPKFSPLKALAEGLTAKTNDLFCRNIVNRLWFVMMGRGLVEPFDLLHADNPQTHPEMLELLAREFAAHDFDIRWLLGQLALTECYQRTSQLRESRPGSPDESSVANDPPSSVDATALADAYHVAEEKRLSAEQLFWSVLVATGELQRVRASRQTADQAGQSAQPTSGDREESAEQLVAESETLPELRKRFIAAFANPPKEPEIDFEPTVKAALFLMHDRHVLQLLEPQPGNLIDGLMGMTDADQIADELFLAILSRHATEEDRADVADYLAKNESRRAEALGHLAWALLASTEFCVNH